MKRLTSFFLFLLMLTGCTTPEEPTPAPQAEPPAVEESKPLPITEESLRAEYEAQDFAVREIVPYEGDFLVYYGNDPYGGIFQWVYGETGLLVRNCRFDGPADGESAFKECLNTLLGLLKGTVVYEIIVVFVIFNLVISRVAVCIRSGSCSASY